MARSYTINDEVIYRDGEPIAKVQGGDLEFFDGMKKYSGPAYRFFNEHAALGDAVEEERSMTLMEHVNKYFDGDLHKKFPDWKGEIDPQAGDKTESLVLHIYHNYPADFAVWYKGRRTCVDTL